MPRPSPRLDGRARAPSSSSPCPSSSFQRPPALLLRPAAARTRAHGIAGAASTAATTSSRPQKHQPLWPCSRGRRAAAVSAVVVSAAAAADGNGAAAPLPAPLQRIVSAFQAVPDPMARYKQLLFYAAKLPPLPEDLRTPENKVEGCVSQVWVVAELRQEDGRVYWRADSDSQLTKGLAALLVGGLSGCSPEEILSVTPGFIEALGLKQSLTPSRNNGFLNMLRKMQRATLALAGGGEGAAAAAAPSS
jgi:sulfur transfer protein SufE